MSESNLERLSILFKSLTGRIPERTESISGSGSNRNYFRVSGGGKSYIGVVGLNLRENEAFIYLCDHFSKKGLRVPKILATEEGKGAYLQEDLGDESLFGLLMADASRENPSEKIKKLYRSVLSDLTAFQVDGDKGLDYTKCYPRQEFDRQSMQWDLNYFKYYYLKLTGTIFDEQKLETDFQLLMDYLLEAPAVYFMYRDFQSRNIMIREDKPWYIDFQGGRRGPLQYDLASLLFQAKAGLTPEFRKEMLEFYLEKLSEKLEFNRQEFVNYYYGFVLLRILQVLGAYGFRGYFEQKPHFLESTTFALENLRWHTDHIQLPINLPELQHCFRQMLIETSTKKTKGLEVEINSFSYKKSGIPKDNSGHGGGFVFDCRALPNPGRYTEYKDLTGKDQPVIDFLSKEQEVSEFLENVYRIVDQAVDNYLSRQFGHLFISFGCTGGQHRSVYCAENLYRHLKDKNLISLHLSHKMLL